APLTFDIHLDASGHLFWQASKQAVPALPVTFNLYRGDQVTLRSTGVYTQQALACGLARTDLDDPQTPPAGRGFFYLVARVSGGVEGSRGTDSAGRQRPSTELCSP